MKYKQSYLGDFLVKEGVITQEQLDDVLSRQKARKDKKKLLGKTLVELGYCRENDLARVISKRAGVPFVSLENFEIEPAAVAAIPPEALKKYRVLPVAIRGGKLVVAMQQPNNILTIDDLRILSGYDIKPVVAPDTELEAAVEKYSRAGIEFEQPKEEEPEAEYIDDADQSASKPAVQLANMIIARAVNDNASDIHIEPFEDYLRVRFRIDGVLHDIMQVPRQLHASLVSRIKIMAGMNIAERRVPQDGRVSLKIEKRNIDARVASLPASFGERLTMRLLDRSAKAISLEELGIDLQIMSKYRSMINFPHGCILVTGPTGSGKSTTLYASLASVDKTAKNVITVEDPVEYRMDGINQIQINPRAGLTFAAGLRSILRSDPDIIMVGEIRDNETAKLAIEAALTGHLVFSTLHTNDAPGAISRLTEMGIEPYLTASSLVCVMAQRLVRVLCPYCKEPYQITREDISSIPDFPLEEDEKYLTLYRPRGCIRCSNTGYKGRTGLYELLFVTEAIQRLALERKSAKEIRKAAVDEGMATMRQDGLTKVKRGITSIEELMRVII